MIPWKKVWWPPFAVFVGALGLRLLFLNQVSEAPFFESPKLDAKYYADFASRLSKDTGFGDEVLRGSPAYAPIIASVKTLFGDSPSTIPTFQAVLGALTAAWLVLLGRRLRNLRTGVLAGTLFGLASTLWIYEAVTVPASIAVFLSVVTFDLATRSPSNRSWVLLGILMGFGVLIRERYAFVAVGMFTLWLLSRELSWRRSLLFLLPFAALVSLPWLNNRLATGESILYTATGGVNFYIGNGPEANGRFYPPDGFRRGRDAMYEDARLVAEREEERSLGPGEVERFWYDKTWAHLAAQPAAVLSNTWKKVLETTRPDESWDVVFGKGLTRWSPLLEFPWVSFVFLLGLGIVGCFLKDLDHKTRFTLFAFLLGQIVFMLIFFGGSRFRTGLYPFLALGSGLFLDRALQLDRSYIKRTLPLVIGLLVVLYRPWESSAEATRPWAIWHTNLAQHLLQEKKVEEAESELREAMALDPGYVKPRNILAQLCYSRGDLVTAEQLFREARAQSPRDLGSLAGHALVLYDLGQADASDEVAALMLEVSPKDPLAHFLRGRRLVERGLYDEAETFLAPIRQHPKFGARVRDLDRTRGRRPPR